MGAKSLNHLPLLEKRLYLALCAISYDHKGFVTNKNVDQAIKKANLPKDSELPTPDQVLQSLHRKKYIIGDKTGYQVIAIKGCVDITDIEFQLAKPKKEMGMKTIKLNPKSYAVYKMLRTCFEQHRLDVQNIELQKGEMVPAIILREYDAGSSIIKTLTNNGVLIKKRVITGKGIPRLGYGIYEFADNIDVLCVGEEIELKKKRSRRKQRRRIAKKIVFEIPSSNGITSAEDIIQLRQELIQTRNKIDSLIGEIDKDLASTMKKIKQRFD